MSKNDVNRISKHATSPGVCLPRHQTATAMFGSALELFSRIELLHQVHGDGFKVLYEATQIPICFVRRSPLTDELDRVDPLSSETISFRNEPKKSPMPALVSTNLTTDLCPPDLYASAYEVRYLTCEEMAMVALRSLARDHLTNEQLEKTRTETQRKNDASAQCDADLFALSADAPAQAKSRWQTDAKCRFDKAMLSALVADATVAAPFDKRPVVCTAIETAHHAESFAKPQANYYWTNVWSKREDGVPDASSTHQRQQDDSGNARLYDADVEFEFAYLHCKTMAPGSNAPGARPATIPADLFAPEFDDASAVALSTSDPTKVDDVLHARLRAALDRFDRPIVTRDDMLKLFGGQARLRRFNALMKWRTQAFGSVSNQRAVSAALLDALHRQVTELENAMLDKAKLAAMVHRGLLGYIPNVAWGDFPVHPQLLHFVSGTDSDYNEWDSDTFGYWRKMYPPYQTAAQFYGRHFFAAMRDAKRGVLCDVLPCNQSASASPAERAFATCWRTTMAKADSALLQSNARQLHEWPTSDMSVRRKEDGKKFIRGLILTLECEPVNSSDPSADNNYGELYRNSRRDLDHNPFCQYFDTLLNYLLGSERLREQTRKTHPEVAAYADTTLASVCRLHHLGPVCQTIENQAVDPSLVKSLSAKLKRAKTEQSWDSTVDALLLRAGRAVDRLTVAQQTALVCLHRAAPFYRSLSEEARPFSTLYDYGAYFYKSLEAWARQNNASKENVGGDELVQQAQTVSQGDSTVIAGEHAVVLEQQIGSGAEQQVDSKTQIDSGAETQVDSGAETQVDSGAETQVDSGVETQVESGTQVDRDGGPAERAQKVVDSERVPSLVELGRKRSALLEELEAVDRLIAQQTTTMRSSSVIASDAVVVAAANSAEKRSISTGSSERAPAKKQRKVSLPPLADELANAVPFDNDHLYDSSFFGRVFAFIRLVHSSGTPVNSNLRKQIQVKAEGAGLSRSTANTYASALFRLVAMQTGVLTGQPNEIGWSLEAHVASGARCWAALTQNVRLRQQHLSEADCVAKKSTKRKMSERGEE